MAGGGVLAAAVGISGGRPLLSASLMAGDGDLSPEVGKALLLMNAAVFVVGWLLVAVPVAVASVSALRTGLMGRTLGWSGVAVAAALAVGSVTMWWVDGLLIVWLLALLWIAAAGVALTRVRRPRDTGTTPATAPSGVSAAPVS